MDNNSSFSKQSLLSLFIILIVLLGIVSFPFWRGYLGFNDNNISSEIDFSEFEKNRITEFAIKHGDEVERFTQKDSKWWLNGKEADLTQVDHFLDVLTTLKVDSLVAKNIETHSDLGLNEEDGYLLTVIHKGKIYDYWIGKTGSDLNSFFLKAKDSNNAYLIKGSLRPLVVQSQDQWSPSV